MSKPNYSWVPDERVTESMIDGYFRASRHAIQLAVVFRNTINSLFPVKFSALPDNKWIVNISWARSDEQ